MTTEELNTLKDRAYKTAVEHGFHEDVKPDAFYLGLVMSEAGEAINADRKGLHADAVLFNDDLAKMPFKDSFEAHIKDSVEDEIADIVIRMLDFAGLRGYKLMITAEHSFASNAIVGTFTRNGLPGTLFYLIGTLSDSLDDNTTEATVRVVISIISDCFDKMTGGSDCDLWWFVEQKMRYNELRPRMNGKKY